MKFLKQLLKKWNVSEAEAAEIISEHIQKKHIKKGRPPSKLELQLTMSLGIKKIYERQKTKSIKRAQNFISTLEPFRYWELKQSGPRDCKTLCMPSRMNLHNPLDI